MIESTENREQRMRVAAEDAIAEAARAATIHPVFGCDPVSVGTWHQVRRVFDEEALELSSEIWDAQRGQFCANLRTEAVQVASIALRIVAMCDQEEDK